MKKLLLILMLCGLASGAVRIVPSQYATVNQAVNAAAAGDTIRIDVDTTYLTARADLIYNRIKVIANGPTNGRSRIMVGNYDGIRFSADSLEIYNCDLQANETATSIRRLLLTNGTRVGGYIISNCTFNSLTGGSSFRGVSFDVSNYETGNFTRSYFRNCKVMSFYPLEAPTSAGLKNVTVDSCYIYGGGPGLETGWKFLNSVVDSFAEIKIRGDDIKIENCFFSRVTGEAISSDDLSKFVYRDTIKNVVIKNNTHVQICVDGMIDGVIDGVTFSSVGAGSGFYVHNENIYDSTYNISIKRINSPIAAIAVWRQKSDLIVFDSCIFYPQSTPTLNMWNATRDTVKNSYYTFYHTQSYPAIDSQNIKVMQGYWMLDTGDIAFTKIRYLDSLPINYMGTFLTNVDTVLQSNGATITFNISSKFRRSNGYRGDDYKVKNTWFSGDTATTRLIYKKSSSDTWVNGVLDTGTAGEAKSLVVGSLDNGEQYDVAVVVSGLSTGTTHMVDTTRIYTFTTAENPEELEITRQPTNTSCVNQRPFSFNLGATEGTNFTWFRNSTDTIIGNNNDTIKGIGKTKFNGAKIFCAVSKGADTVWSDTVTLTVTPTIHKWPTVKSWAYCLQDINWFPSGQRTDYLTFLMNTYDLNIGIERGDSIKALFPSNWIINYNLATNMTVYNRSTNTFSGRFATLKAFCDTAYSRYGYSSAADAIESCFMHLTEARTITFATGTPRDTIHVHPYDPENPINSRLPAAWQKNSDWSTNLASPIYRAWWAEVNVPFYTDNIDGMYLDVQVWPIEQINPNDGIVLEFPSMAIFNDSLSSATHSYLNLLNGRGKNLFINNHYYNADTTFQFYKDIDGVNREVEIYYFLAANTIKKLLRGAVKTSAYGTMSLLHHRAEFKDRTESGSYLELRNRDRVAGLACYLMANDLDVYYFSYLGGLVYGGRFDTAAWCGLFEKDFGQPKTDVNWSWATGVDPSTPQVNYQVWRRDFDSCIVLIKPRPSADYSGVYTDASETKHYLQGTYALLDEFGNHADTITDTVRLRNWEAAILVPVNAPEPPPPPPVITTHPQSQTVNETATATFTIAATSATSYQWYGNGSLISGATGTTYSFTATLDLNGSEIYCRVANATDTVWSDTAVLTVTPYTPPPTITFGVDTLILVCNSANGDTYQWYQNGVAMSGRTSEKLIIFADSAFYALKPTIYCMVTNDGGSTKSGEWRFNAPTNRQRKITIGPNIKIY